MHVGIYEFYFVFLNLILRFEDLVIVIIHLPCYTITCACGMEIENFKSWKLNRLFMAFERMMRSRDQSVCTSMILHLCLTLSFDLL